jgi:hypothetical protein
MAQADVQHETRRSRFWLYTPFVLLGLIAVAWSAAWWVIRTRTGEAIDGWLAAEAKIGRQWTCQDRQIGGYPFRIEVTCANLSVQRGPVTASLGRIEAVAQVYQPRHVITEIEGPLKMTDGSVAVEGTWRLLETSIHGAPSGFQRISLVAENPNVRVTGAGPSDLALSSQHLEAHLRPSPSRQPEAAYDASLLASQAKLPIVDNLIGGSEPANIQADVTATQAGGFRGRPVADELERWRKAGGKLDIVRLSVAKGPRRLEAKGELHLDEIHRPAGQFEVAAAGLDELVTNLTAGRVGGNLVSALLGQTARVQARGNAEPALTPLPPLRLDNGRLAFGPFVVPNVRLGPLY